uniref:Uncharacterized protein n=1 Tax=Ciona savignyi TaxID=51511 RepID=H2YFU9_CIOSA
ANTATGTNYTGSRFESNETATPADNSTCPTVDRTSFTTEVVALAASAIQVNPDDVTQTDIDSVVDFIQEDVICTNCNCTTLSQNLGVLEEFEFDSGLSCGQCWSTKLASLTRNDSEIAEPLGLAASRRATPP